MMLLLSKVPEFVYSLLFPEPRLKTTAETNFKQEGYSNLDCIPRTTVGGGLSFNFVHQGCHQGKRGRGVLVPTLSIRGAAKGVCQPIFSKIFGRLNIRN